MLIGFLFCHHRQGKRKWKFPLRSSSSGRLNSNLSLSVLYTSFILTFEESKLGKEPRKNGTTSKQNSDQKISKLKVVGDCLEHQIHHIKEDNVESDFKKQNASRCFPINYLKLILRLKSV
jgi:hypothetical protein